MRKHDKRESHLREIHGHVLMASLMLILIMSVLSMTAFYLAGQNVPGISAMREESTSLQLADAATELAIGWFHDSTSSPASIAGLLMKRQDDPLNGPSFFDTAGRSQFVGTSDRPDILLDAAGVADAQVLNAAPSGFSGPLLGLGRLEQLKVYGPSQPGFLGTLEVTASTVGRRPMARTIRVQLGALNMPAVRAAVQTGGGLGVLRPGGESPVLAHWGDIRVAADMVLNRVEDAIVKGPAAPVTDQSYELMRKFEDRWIDYWIGGTITLLSPPTNATPTFPANVHVNQYPTPDVRLDRWDYNFLKRTAQRYGTYYRLDREGRLHMSGALESDPRLLPAEVLASPAVGQSRGLLFIDTLDGEPPRADNLGTLVLDVDYVEALLVVQGHVRLRPGGPGRSVPVLSPSPEGLASLGSRVPVTLSSIHLNGVLQAAGTITLERDIRLYGAVMRHRRQCGTTNGGLVQRRLCKGALSGTSGCVSCAWYMASEILSMRRPDGGPQHISWRDR